MHFSINTDSDPGFTIIEANAEYERTGTVVIVATLAIPKDQVEALVAELQASIKEQAE
jgi:hypothetical protein